MYFWKLNSIKIFICNQNIPPKIEKGHPSTIPNITFVQIGSNFTFQSLTKKTQKLNLTQSAKDLGNNPEAQSRTQPKL
jgi:hypothetical protein